MRGRTMVPHFFSLLVIFFTTVWGEKISDYCPVSRCGNIMIEYPFYLRADVSSASNRSGICGYQGFGISCDRTNKTAYFTLPSDIYVVLNIDYARSRLSLVDTEIHFEACPKPRHNVSLGTNSSLKLNPQNTNFTFFIDCRRPLDDQNIHPAIHASHNLTSISCMGNSSHNQSYAIPSASADRIDWRAAGCDRAVVVPLMGVPVTGPGVFPTEVKGGYVLDWNLTMQCARCEVSGGRCGYYNGSSAKPQFVCYCNGGTTDRECRANFALCVRR